MSETTGTTSRKSKPKPPEPTPREKLITEVADNLTFKSDCTDEQKAAFGWVKDNFRQFNEQMEQLLDHSTIRKRLTATDDYKAFQESSRAAERRANAAIACDWKPDSAFDVDTAEGLQYPIKETTTSEEQRLCFEVSKAIFELTMKLLAYLPLGRYLSIFRTEMEVARGWLIDTINRN